VKSPTTVSDSVAPSGDSRARHLTLGPATRWALLIAFGVIGSAGLLALLYATSVHAVPGNSDGATVMLEGQAMAAGHFGLKGWVVGLDAFWTLDALVYAVAIGIAGLHPMLLNFIPALIAAIVVIVGVLLAREGQRGKAAVAGGVTVFVLLGLPSFDLSFWFLQGPLHVTTALACLLAFIGVRNGRFGWGWCIAVVLLAMATLGDLQALAFGIAPVALGGVIAMRRERDWRSGIAQLCAAAAAGLLTIVVRLVMDAVGTFVINAPNPTPSKGQLVRNLPISITLFSKLLGVGTGSIGGGGVPRGFELAHLVTLIVVCVATIGAVVALVVGVVRGDTTAPFDLIHRSPRASAQSTPDQAPAWRLDDLLLLAMIADFAVFVRLAFEESITFSRYLTAALIFGSILTGRLAARAVARYGTQRLARPVLAAGGICAVAVAAGFGFELAQPNAARPAVALGDFLVVHHLTQGIGDYWNSSIVTVETSGTVKIRPIVQGANGKLEPYERGDLAWFASSERFNFLVCNTTDPFGNVTTATAISTFGKPSHTYFVTGGYDVLVWSHPFTLTPTSG
jgi:hypothetical protein